MPIEDEDLSTLSETRTQLDKLIEACRTHGPLHSRDRFLANEVARGAKALQASLARIVEAADDPRHEPGRPLSARAKGTLFQRLYEEAPLHELARFVSYGGKRADQVKEFMRGHRERHGDKALWALMELTASDEDSGLTVLKPEARRACRVLLGPAPGSEEYEGYWRLNGCEPPADHSPPPPAPAPPPEPQEEPAKPKRRKARGGGKGR